MAKSIFCATHPRACSTAFERVFLTRNDLVCAHEPFGDAFYYGPERMSTRFAGKESERTASGFDASTYKTIFDRLKQDGAEGKRVFIKDMMYYLMPPDQEEAQIAPSLQRKERGVGTSEHATNGTNGVKKVNGSAELTPFPYHTETEPGNPTIVPRELLEKFHFTFLIRDPHSSIPSYYRCTIPPLAEMTGWDEYLPNEAGYDELRRFFDYMRESGQIGPHFAKDPNSNGEVKANGDHTNGTNGINGINGINGVNGDRENHEICVIDADDLLDDPEAIMRTYCESIGLDYNHDMLIWDTDEEQSRARDAFEKWKGWHEDALDSKDLKPRAHKTTKTEEQWDKEWKKKFGEEAAKMIRKTVDANMEDYRYLKQFAVKV